MISKVDRKNYQLRFEKENFYFCGRNREPSDRGEKKNSGYQITSIKLNFFVSNLCKEKIHFTQLFNAKEEKKNFSSFYQKSSH